MLVKQLQIFALSQEQVKLWKVGEILLLLAMLVKQLQIFALSQEQVKLWKVGEILLLLASPSSREMLLTRCHKSGQ